LALFGPQGYGARLGLIMLPSRFAQGTAPWLFGLALDAWGSAAIGLTERTDAIAVVVSEETGAISICENGILHRNLTEKQFREKIAEIFVSGKPTHATDPTSQLDRKGSVTSSGDSDLVSH
jgi:hypothetical protein